MVTSQHGRDYMTLQLEEGKLCLELFLQMFHLSAEIIERPLKISSTESAEGLLKKPSGICLSNMSLNDGEWHSVFARRLVILPPLTSVGPKVFKRL